MSGIYQEILNRDRLKVYKSLSDFRDHGYLAGGTALALQLNHRKSVDFDVFIEKPISNVFKQNVKRTFGQVDYYVNTSDQISFKTKENVEVTFVWYYFKPLFPLIKTDSLSLASIDDIAADKAHTIARRAVWRDYVDIFCLLKDRHTTLDKIIGLAKKKFAGEFNEALFLQQVTYYSDMIESPIEFIKQAYSASEIKSFLKDVTKEYLQRISTQELKQNQGQKPHHSRGRHR